MSAEEELFHPQWTGIKNSKFGIKYKLKSYLMCEKLDGAALLPACNSCEDKPPTEKDRKKAFQEVTSGSIWVKFLIILKWCF